jgi:hypothetical protein
MHEWRLASTANCNWTANALGSSHRRPYQPNEFPHTIRIFNAFAELHSAADIDGKRPHFGHSLLDVLAREPASEYQGLSLIHI